VRLAGASVLEFEVGESVSSAARRHAGEDRLAAAMTSQVVDVPVKPGDRVRKGDTLVVLEAMKMETRVAAPHDATVKAVLCAAGDVVEKGKALVELEQAS
jgi:3-methylcrotonyl-CoA carboxylase alpha subunit